MKFTILACLSVSFAAMGQTSQSNGVNSEWDVQKLLDSLKLQAQHLQPIIQQVKPETWVANGAPQAYVTQWKTAQDEIKYLVASCDALEKQPERLTLALDAFFRMQAMESTLGSVIEGVRKYQNPALADLVRAVMGENSANRERLRQYITDLAAQKEQEFTIADREAQRCRETLMQQKGKPVRK